VETTASSSNNDQEVTPRRRRRRNVGLLVAALGLAVEALTLVSRGYGIGGNVIVRCREGHLFTTIWIPGTSVKSLRLGWTRFQHCPVGNHWSLVTPVPASELTEDERRAADQRHDVRVP
jgi:hypothetical protein